jgi:serine/threonine protein kinase
MDPTCFGRYILIERIAAGGMGEVFVAVPRSLWGYEKFFAVKKILPSLSQDPEFLIRFKDEARLVVPMNHPNIVQVFEVGRVGEEYFIAMERVDGRNLGQTMARASRERRRLPVAGALFIIRELLAGLEYCHTRTDEAGDGLGMVHRDVSPSNVLLSYEGAVKLADFGLALSRFRSAATKPRCLLGHLGYIAPEGLEGRRLDPRADLYSAGVLLFELLTGERFAYGVDPLVVRREMRVRARLRPSSFRPDVLPELDEIVARALEPSPERRYQSARQFHIDLQRLLARIDPLYDRRELAESTLQLLFDADRPRRRLRELVQRIDIEEVEQRHPSGRTVCLAEAIPLRPPTGETGAPRRRFGTDAAVLTVNDDLYEGATEPVTVDSEEKPPPSSRPRVQRGPARRDPHRRRRWLTPAPMVTPAAASEHHPLLFLDAKTKP